MSKPPNNPGPTGVQVYRGSVNRPPAPLHTGTMALNQAPSSTSHNPTSMSMKMPIRPPQKLTLMAPQDCGGGTQGVAKLITSSMVGGKASNIGVQKSAGPGLFSPPLTILTPPYKQNGGKMPAPASLSVLSTLNSFPLRVVSFTTEPSPKAGASKDAIVTGPAPGTFNHGLPRSKCHPSSLVIIPYGPSFVGYGLCRVSDNVPVPTPLFPDILGGLHTSTGQHTTPIPRPSLSGHLQPAQTADGAHAQSKGAPPSQFWPYLRN
ncbi:unnamed protein product [Ranitomeya imitator]|uniref:Uncharacterized protein n=1 Tax=Ranitomeya imitator TaxID=111125 RepID=A0ABN9LZ61_9NEOB|nr:unnamed protein product [Ranitomeya imitator]